MSSRKELFMSAPPIAPQGGPRTPATADEALQIFSQDIMSWEKIDPKETRDMLTRLLSKESAQGPLQGPWAVASELLTRARQEWNSPTGDSFSPLIAACLTLGKKPVPAAPASPAPAQPAPATTPPATRRHRGAAGGAIIGAAIAIIAGIVVVIGAVAGIAASIGAVIGVVIGAIIGAAVIGGRVGGVIGIGAVIAGVAAGIGAAIAGTVAANGGVGVGAIIAAGIGGVIGVTSVTLGGVFGGGTQHPQR